MKGASPAPTPDLFGDSGSTFLDTASAQLMFTDGIDELLNINLCRSNIFNGLYNENFLLIKLPKCFLTPWAVFLERGDIARVCFLQVDMRKSFRHGHCFLLQESVSSMILWILCLKICTVEASWEQEKIFSLSSIGKWAAWFECMFMPG